MSLLITLLLPHITLRGDADTLTRCHADIRYAIADAAIAIRRDTMLRVIDIAC